MAVETLTQGAKPNRTKILAGGVRVRVMKPGETDEQIKAWQDSIIKRSGCPSMVLPTQASLDLFLERSKKRDHYRALVERVMAQYFAGELVEKRRA